MSFQNNIYIKRKKSKLHRKENDSYLAHHFVKISLTLKERASAFTSKGSITLEAALSASFFFFAVLCLMYLFEIMVLQTNIKSALHAVAKEVAVETYVNPTIPTTKMECRIAELIGEERLEKSFIVNGCHGLDCSGSKKYWNTTIMDLQVCYQLEIPIVMFRIPLLAQEETVRVKGWTGHELKVTGREENVMVYVTEYGIVYHADVDCSYLELSIKPVEEKEVENLRNQNGEEYKECLACNHVLSNTSKVYITDYGNRYHKSLECSKIKRNIYTISLDDVHGLGGCSKCVK